MVKEKEEALLASVYASPYFFDARVMAEAPPQFLALDKVYRQRDDAFIAVLNKVRNNQMDHAALETINSRLLDAAKEQAPENIITLTSHNYQADRINLQALAELNNEPTTYSAIISREFPPRNYPVDETLQLKPGARVMFVKNDTSGARQYFNGKMGTVIRLDADEVTVMPDGADLPVIRGRAEWANTRYRWNDHKKSVEEEVLGSFQQFPLRLAWAISIHKSQGLTFEKMIVDAARSFTAGQVYVALSRATELSGIWLNTPISADVIAVHPRVVRFHEKDRPVNMLVDKVAEGKKNYIEQSLLQVFDFTQYRLSLASLNLIYRQLPPMDAQPFVEWQQKIVEGLNIFQQQTDAWLPALIGLVSKMHSANGLVELNEWLEANTQGFIKNVATEMDGWKKWLPSRFQLAESEHYEKLDENLKKLFDAISIHKTKLLRLQQGYSEASFFPQSRYEVEMPAPAQKKKNTNSEVAETPVGDKKLTEALRQTIIKIAAEREVPVYVVLAFRYLDAIAATMPQTLDELALLPGFGHKNILQIGQVILDTVAQFRQANPDAQPMADAVSFGPKKRRKSTEPKAAKEDTVTITLGFWEKGMPLEEIATTRSMVVGTVKGHLAKAIKKGLIDGNGMVSDAILDAVNTLSPDDNSPLRPEMLRDRYGIAADWGDLQIARALLALRNTTDMADKRDAQ